MTQPEPRRWNLHYDGRPWTDNAARVMHWTRRAEFTRTWRRDFYLLTKAAKVPHLERVSLTFTPIQARGNLADVGAHALAVKAAQDGIADACLDDDDPSHVVAHLVLPAVRGPWGMDVTITDLRGETP